MADLEAEAAGLIPGSASPAGPAVSASAATATFLIWYILIGLIRQLSYSWAQLSQPVRQAKLVLILSQFSAQPGPKSAWLHCPADPSPAVATLPGAKTACIHERKGLKF